MEIGDRIRARREELGMSQDELARAIGYKSRSSINKMELDGRGLPQKKIVALAKALRVTPAYLMGWEDEEAIADEHGLHKASSYQREEEEILRKVRLLSDVNKHLLLGIIDSMITSQEEIKK